MLIQRLDCLFQFLTHAIRQSIQQHALVVLGERDKGIDLIAPCFGQKDPHFAAVQAVSAAHDQRLLMHLVNHLGKPGLFHQR